MAHIIVVVVTLFQSKVGQSTRLQDWLQAKGVESPTNALKAELYSIIQRLKPTPHYVVDDIGAAAGKNLVKIALVFIDMYIIQGMRWSDSLLLTALSILLSWHGHRLKVTSRPAPIHHSSGDELDESDDSDQSDSSDDD